jgi:hypothetical protein
VISYDFLANYVPDPLGPVNNVGSFSLQPSTTAQSLTAVKVWATAGSTYQSQYNVFNADGSALNSQMPYTAPLDVLTLNRWYHEEMTLDFTTHQVLKVSLTDLATSDTQTATPNGWYLLGGANSTAPLPTAVRFFTGGANPGNVMAWDNLNIVPEPSTLCLLGFGLAGLVVVVAKRRRV